MAQVKALNALEVRFISCLSCTLFTPPSLCPEQLAAQQAQIPISPPLAGSFARGS